MAQKLFRDPLYDYISIDRDEHEWLLELANCAELQRLRYISQLGLCQLTYPGSTHSRFSHSLGVLHLMEECLAHLKRDHANCFGPLDENALLAAALLHDIGHGPFSHATESIFGNHEAMGIKMIRSDTSEIHAVLSKHASELPSRVAALFEEGVKAPLWQKSLISSQLDLDRLDYLRRDSLYSGAEYGHFDCFRIIHTMELREKVIEGRHRNLLVVWPEKSKFALEEYLFSRFYMYQSVYFHHTTRGYEGLLDRILTRARDLCSRLMARQGIAWAEAPAGTSFEMEQRINAVRNYLKKQGKDSEYYFIEHAPQATPYKPYSSASAGEEQTSVNSIMLYDPKWPGTGFREISEAPQMERLRAITTAQQPVFRYYFPKEHETEIRNLLKD
jgi:HD superfamily phosphohydrolase